MPSSNPIAPEIQNVEVYVSFDSEGDHSAQRNQNLLGGTRLGCRFFSIEVINSDTWVNKLKSIRESICVMNSGILV